MPNQGFIAAAAALLLALPATASAADPLPVGEAHGVRLTTGRDGAAFHFSKRAAGLYRQIAGRTVEVSCTWLRPHDDRLGVSLAGEATGHDLRVPRKRAPLRYRGRTRGADYCEIAPSREGVTDEAVVSIPLTQTGAITLDEREKVGVLYGLLTFAGIVADRSKPSAFPTPARMIASRAAREMARAGVRVVALTTATDTPPAGTYGYWSDGRREVAVVALSAAGRRLHINAGPEGEISTNVLGIFLGILD